MTYVAPSHHWASCWAVVIGVDITVTPTLNVCIIAISEVEDPGSCIASLFVVERVGGAVRRECFGSDVGKSKSARKSCQDGSDGERLEKHLDFC